MKKEGWWAIGDIYYGYLAPRCFTQVAVPEARGFAGSAAMHRFASIEGVRPEKAIKDGPINVSTAWCGCVRCCKHDFASCLMKGRGGFASQVKYVDVPRVSMCSAPSQTSTLAEFAATLAKGQIRAVAVDSRDAGIEGSFWLCEVLGPAHQATELQAHATDLFEEGWWIVEILWYVHQNGSTPRKYKLDASSRRWLAVNAMIRVDGLQFSGGQRVPKSGLRLLSERSRELIEAMNE